MCRPFLYGQLPFAILSGTLATVPLTLLPPTPASKSKLMRRCVRQFHPCSDTRGAQGVEWTQEEDRLLIEQLTLMRGGAFSTKNMTVRRPRPPLQHPHRVHPLYVRGREEALNSLVPVASVASPAHRESLFPGVIGMPAARQERTS